MEGLRSMSVRLWIMKGLVAECRRDSRGSEIMSIMKKSVGQRIPEKEIANFQFEVMTNLLL